MSSRRFPLLFLDLNVKKKKKLFLKSHHFQTLPCLVQKNSFGCLRTMKIHLDKARFTPWQLFLTTDGGRWNGVHVRAVRSRHLT